MMNGKIIHPMSRVKSDPNLQLSVHKSFHNPTPLSSFQILDKCLISRWKREGGREREMERKCKREGENERKTYIG